MEEHPVAARENWEGILQTPDIVQSTAGGLLALFGTANDKVL